MAAHFFPLQVSNIYKETPECVVVSFSIPEQLQETFTFIQGQYLTLEANIDNTLVRRSYSICASPTDGVLSVAIKKVTNGIFSTYANESLQKGDILQVMPPNGKFFTQLQPENTNHYVFIACGSGITPVISNIKAILQAEPNSTISLVYSNRNRQSIIFFEALEALKNKHVQQLQIIHILSRERTESDLHYGRIQKDKLIRLSHIVPFGKAAHIFICGPEEMIFTAKDYFTEIGIDAKRIHFELFGTNKKALHNTIVTTEIDTDAADIKIIVDGRSIDFKLNPNSHSILDAALQQGADLPYACKGGVCCTCKAKLLSGTVSMDVNYALEPEEVAQGYVLTCQAHPTSKALTVDFDIK